MRHLITFAVISLFLIAPNLGFSSLGDMTIRTELGSLEGIVEDKAFNETAVVTGRCRDVEENLNKLRSTMWMYRLDKKDNGRSKVKQVGAYFVNEHGARSACFDEFGISTVIEKNIHGDRVEITGVIIPGNRHSLNHDEIILIDSMELRKVVPE